LQVVKILQGEGLEWNQFMKEGNIEKYPHQNLVKISFSILNHILFATTSHFEGPTISIIHSHYP